MDRNMDGENATNVLFFLFLLCLLKDKTELNPKSCCWSEYLLGK